MIERGIQRTGNTTAWRADGIELFYLGVDNRIYAVPLKLASAFEVGAPTALFSVRWSALNSPRWRYDVSPDGQRCGFWSA